MSRGSHRPLSCVKKMSCVFVFNHVLSTDHVEKRVALNADGYDRSQGTLNVSDRVM